MTTSDAGERNNSNAATAQATSQVPIALFGSNA